MSRSSNPAPSPRTARPTRSSRARSSTYQIDFVNNGGSPAQSFVITDQIPSETDFKVGSVTTDLGSTGMTVAIVYSNDNGTSYAYTPTDGGGGAPAGYDRTVTHVRWLFTGNLPASGVGNVGFTVRIR